MTPWTVGKTKAGMPFIFEGAPLRLLQFAHVRRDLRLEVDHRALTGLQLGRVRMTTMDPGDVEYAIRLPQPRGMEKYVGSYVLP